jgi:drug/metabolite transporter (DMT)-like permease
MKPDLRMGAAEWALLVLLSVLWGGSFFFYKLLVTVLPPFTVVMGRVGLAAVLLNAWLIIRGEPMPLNPNLWFRFLLMGLLNNVIPFSLIAFGETRVSSGLASILNATTPIFAVLTAHFLTSDEKITWNRLAGVGLGFAGTAVLVGPDSMQGLEPGKLVGEVACLLAAVSYALAGVFGRGFRDVAPIKVATGQITASAFVLLPVSLLVDRPWTLPTPGITTWLCLAGIALLCTALGYVVYFRLLAAAGATNLLLVTFLLPVSSLVLGCTVLGETITFDAVGGMALIGLGLAAIDGRLVKRITSIGSRRGTDLPAT